MYTTIFSLCKNINIDTFFDTFLCDIFYHIFLPHLFHLVETKPLLDVTLDKCQCREIFLCLNVYKDIDIDTFLCIFFSFSTFLYTNLMSPKQSKYLYILSFSRQHILFSVRQLFTLLLCLFVTLLNHFFTSLTS
jgi:hypothetical protein